MGLFLTLVPGHVSAQTPTGNIESKKALLKLAEQEGDLSQQALFLKLIGADFQQQSAFDSALTYYSRGLTLSEAAGNLELSSALVYNISLIYRIQGSYGRALEYALRALKADRELGDQANVAASLNSVSLIYQEMGLYDKALDYTQESIEISRSAGNTEDLAIGRYNLGNILLKTGKTDVALNNFNLAAEGFNKMLALRPGDPSLRRMLSETVYSKGEIYFRQAKYGQALENFQQALEVKEALGDRIGIGNCYNYMGLTYMQMKEYDLAEQALFTAFNHKNQFSDRKGLALASLGIGRMNLERANYEGAENFLQRSIAIGLEIDDKEILREGYKLMYQLNSQRSRYQEALKYHTLFKDYSDSLQNEKTVQIVEELNVQYETEKKEQENQILVRNNQIDKLTIQKQRSMGMYLIGTIILVLMIVVIIFILYRSKQKTNKIISLKNTQLEEQNAQINEQKRIIELKNLDLMDSIQYAKRIQDSMLVNVERLNDILEDAFIFFRPKDVVSGDFYWFGMKGDRFIISAIDCTGHGVPGAFMSMLGNTYLNQIIYDQGITSPEKILEALSQEVQDGLKQSETSNQDGMDMALCSIDMKKKYVDFAGAKNPLVYIQNGEAVRLKADRLPIGISFSEDQSFHNQRIEVRSPSCFYMFSDGFPDQFGGEDGGKFMTKRLQALFQEIHGESMNRQKEILGSTLDEWMKDEEQIDDILVIGFRLE